MAFTIDFTGVEAKDFSAIPAGTYPGKVFAVEVKPSQTGNPNMRWTVKIVGGEYNDRQFFMNTSLQPAALWKLKTVLKNIAPELNLDGMADLDTDDLVGRDCGIVIGTKLYNGETVNDVKNLISADKAGNASEDLPFNVN